MTHYGRFIERSLANLGELKPEEEMEAEKAFSTTFHAAHCRLADAMDDFKREVKVALLPAWLRRRK